LKADGVTPTEIAARLGIGRASVYRVLSQKTGVVRGMTELADNHPPVTA
jgi:DNA-binding transcriptional regulator LsrR (DeoR family)